MANSGIIEKVHANYILSGCWICDTSPTGAHYWVEVRLASVKAGTFVCKYCGESKVFPLVFDYGILTLPRE